MTEHTNITYLPVSPARLVQLCNEVVELLTRVEVRDIFARYLADAESRQNSPEMALIEALQYEVLQAIGGDTPRI
ncbi:MAG TPA: hypothetical protein VNN23_08140 [Ornithinibacter sp.]|nr:hypothetical protein [Ornithinibacter sp.]